MSLGTLVGMGLGASTGGISSFLPSLISGGSSLLGGLFGNKSSSNSAKKAMKFEAEQSQINRDWQERLSSSAHQREVADLRAAGLNPILSGTGGMGANTPSGSSAKDHTYKAENVLAPAVSSAQAQQQLGLTSDIQKADIDVKRAQQNNINAQTLTELMRPENVEKDTRLKTHQGTLEGERFYKTAAERKQIEQYMAKHLPAIVQNLYSQISMNTASAKSLNVKAELDTKLSEYERLLKMGESGSKILGEVLPGKLLRKFSK